MPSIEKEAVKTKPKSKYVDITITLKLTDEVSKFYIQKNCDDPCCGDIRNNECYCDNVPAENAKQIIDDLGNNSYGGPNGPISELSDVYNFFDYDEIDWKITIVDHKEK